MNSKVKNNLKVAGVIVTVLFIAMCNAVNNRTCDPYDATGTMKAIEEENDKKALVAALTVKRSLRNPDSLVLRK